MFRLVKRCLSTVLVQDYPNVRMITLNREKALNAVNEEMVVELLRAMKCEDHRDTIIVKGAGGKAFCAGGDVVSIVKDEPKGTRQSFFYKEYQMNYYTMTTRKTQVSLWEGIVMGGGVGLSVHGKFRVATENALFAMPETSIGLFPDVGGSYFLPRLPRKSFGLYLALVGDRVKGADLVHAGIATHFVPSDLMWRLEGDLCQLRSNSSLCNPTPMDIICANQPSTLPPFTFEPHLQLIDKHFDPAKTVEEIVDSLKGDDHPFAAKALKAMSKCSPTSLKVTHELFNRGAKITDQKKIFAMEYVCTQRAMDHGDFAAGVTALLIDKTKAPVWNPPTLEGVTREMVESFFRAPGAGVPIWSPDVAFEKAPRTR
jgi:3-hydroxyisobutyryl-CoA hydrolase